MTTSLEQQAGSAMVWRSIQLIGIKGIFLARMLILARLLFPEDFGLFAIAISATGFLVSITNVGLLPAVVQAENMDERRYAAVWTFDMTRSLFTAALTILLAAPIADVFGEPLAIPIIQALALRPFCESLTSIKMTALNRNLMFRPLAYLKIVEAIANTAISISLANLVGVWALVFGALGGTLAMVITSYALAPYRPRLLFHWRSLRPLMKFGGWMLATSLISMAGIYGLRIAISRQLGAESLGLYFIAAQLAYLPSEFARELVGSVAFPLFARLQKDIVKATRIFRAVFSGLAAILYPMGALLIVLAPTLTDDILGPKWVGTTNVMRILTVVVMIGVLGEVAVTVFRGFGEVHKVTLLEVVQSSIAVTLVWTLTSRFGLEGAALAWLPSILLSQILCVWLLRKTLGNAFRGLQRPFAAIIAATALCGVMAWTVIGLLPGIGGVVAAAGVGAASAAALLWLADRRFDLGVSQGLALVFPQYVGSFRVSRMEGK